jgi:hypothetical protein
MEALKIGETRYFTGIPCKWGHVAFRCVRSRQCQDCAAVYKIRKRDAIKYGLRPGRSGRKRVVIAPPSGDLCSWLLSRYSEKIRN